ncbi:hypothetical protein CAPTEDRAFT_205022 [Capitella teleta]|uniref:Uncharacterized protein n=1 Tax=Capitella teleta TaxID=283909 RepID=R7T718_CAPTE|nr:hypothetical protein CAPTEDRAFT_205022 [Capitella teleta]|eukprot:ELT87145.1 hypothetical protein CAPTEDRAFT_205022 [Capitella teleta]
MEQEEHKIINRAKALNALLQTELNKELHDNEKARQKSLVGHREEIHRLQEELKLIRKPPVRGTVTQRKAHQTCAKKVNDILEERKWKSHLNIMADNQARAAVDSKYKVLLPARGELLREVHDDYGDEDAATGVAKFMLYSKSTQKCSNGYSKNEK